MNTAAAEDTDIDALEELIDGPPPRCQTWVINKKCNEEATVTVKICCCNSVAHLCSHHFEWLKSGGSVRCTNCGAPNFEWRLL